MSKLIQSVDVPRDEHTGDAVVDITSKIDNIVREVLKAEID